MKKNKLKVALIAILCIVSVQFLSAQVEDFESFIAKKDSGQVLNGSNGKKSLNIQSVMNLYLGWDTSFGGYWASNWAVSSVIYNKIETSDFSKHLYAAAPGWGAKGVNDRAFAVGQNFARFALLPSIGGAEIHSLKISNSTYAYNSMKFGDAFAKKFKNSDKDSFVLLINGYLSSQLVSSHRVVLADFRNADTTKNFILRTWQTVNFNAGEDSLEFILFSSDNSKFGMNTPAYFVMDDLEFKSTENVTETSKSNMTIYPNPTRDWVEIRLAGKNIATAEVFDIQGKRIITENSNKINLSGLINGIYVVQILTESGEVYTSKLIKN